MLHYITFHFYNKIHIIHRSNLEKSWTKVQNERRKLRTLMERKEYFEL